MLSFWQKKRLSKGFGTNATSHIGPIYFWRDYLYFDKWDDYEEFGIGISIKLYFYFALVFRSNALEFILRITNQRT